MWIIENHDILEKFPFCIIKAKVLLKLANLFWKKKMYKFSSNYLCKFMSEKDEALLECLYTSLKIKTVKKGEPNIVIFEAYIA